MKFIEDQWNFNRIYWILLEFYCIYWYSLFFNVSPLGPAGEMEKSRFFALSDPNWTGVGKPSFCQRARLVGVTRSTEGAFDSYPTPSVRIPRCLGARGAEGGTEIAKAKRRARARLAYKIHRNLNTSVSGLYLKSLMFFRLPLQTSP